MVESSRRPQLALAALLALAGAVPAQSLAEETGLAALRRRLGREAPTGRGVSVGQVEASVPGWVPAVAHPELAGRSYVLHSAAPLPSRHGTAVGLLLYGAVGGLAPGVEEVHAWDALHWLGPGFLNGASAAPPLASPAKVLNHSWISAGSSNVALRKLDAAIDAQGLVVCVGVNNGAGPLDVPLLSHSFNTITCGRSDGEHRSGFTRRGLDRPGRVKPEIVAPAAATSFATPIVAGACALLVETARSALASNPDAERPEVIKAALLAGANHREGWSNAAPTAGARRGATTTPLDFVWGADELQVDRAHWILSGGEQEGAALAEAAPLAAPQGWEFASVAAGESRWWRFEVESTKERVSVLATWHRQSLSGWGTSLLPNFDLELWRVGAGGELLSLVGDGGLEHFDQGNVASASVADNLEHLYVRELREGTYALELRRSADALAPWSVAVAWEFACATPQAFGRGSIDATGVEARLGWRGIPSRSGGGFQLELRGGPPGAVAVLCCAREPFSTTPVAAPGLPLERRGIFVLDARGELDLPLELLDATPGEARAWQVVFRRPGGRGALGATNWVRVAACR